MDLPPPPVETTPLPRRRRTPLLVGTIVIVVVVAAVLALAVFEVQTLFTNEEVAEAGPAFESGAVAPTVPEEGADTSAPPTGAAGSGAPDVTVASTGTFVDKGHPGEGTARLLTDGTQTFVRFEDDFATDNGPDLRVRAVVDGEHVDLGALKGNRGAQNYELPGDIDPTAVTAVDVWCRRFDYVFTEATLA